MFSGHEVANQVKKAGKAKENLIFTIFVMNYWIFLSLQTPKGYSNKPNLEGRISFWLNIYATCAEDPKKT